MTEAFGRSPVCRALQVSVSQLQFESGKMIRAAQYGKQEEDVQVELSEDEQKMEAAIRVRSLGARRGRRVQREVISVVAKTFPVRLRRRL